MHDTRRMHETRRMHDTCHMHDTRRSKRLVHCMLYRECSQYWRNTLTLLALLCFAFRVLGI